MSTGTTLLSEATFAVRGNGSALLSGLGIGKAEPVAERLVLPYTRSAQLIEAKVTLKVIRTPDQTHQYREKLLLNGWFSTGGDQILYRLGDLKWRLVATEEAAEARKVGCFAMGIVSNLKGEIEEGRA